MELLTTSIVNKILHLPTVRMKEVAGRDECYLYVDALRTLFDLDGAAKAPEAAGAADADAAPPVAFPEAGREGRAPAQPGARRDPGADLAAGDA